MRAALGFSHLPKTEGFSLFNRMLSHLAAKTVYCAVSCWPKWSSTAAWSCSHWGHLMFERKLPYPTSTVNLQGEDMSNAELGQASPAWPSGDSPLCTPRAAHLSANTPGFSLCSGLFHLYPACLAQGKSPAYHSHSTIKGGDAAGAHPNPQSCLAI